ncbi:MAG: hypothetical protein LUO84_05870, partial [Methanomassiliicoccales archaeon]|nr:hypothetical protein [Methanomassiliicoccales archaeon]
MKRLLGDHSMMRPRFSDCWVNPSTPPGSKEIEEYLVSDARVRIVSLPGGVRTMYHVTPWEYNLPSGWTTILWKTIEALSRRPPPNIGSSYDELREHVLRVSPNLLIEIAEAGFTGQD